jgi:Alginate lyase
MKGRGSMVRKRIKRIIELEYDRVIDAANQALTVPPGSITFAISERSAGGPHDYFSEGDYWWPDPNNSDGPYIRRDGLINPDNFTEHRHALIRLGTWVSTLAAAYKLSGESRYAERAAQHLRIWFLDANTFMSPHLQYAQAISGRVTGRSIGIVDTIHMVEIVQAIRAISESGALSERELRGLKGWFADYLRWIDTHPNGVEYRLQKNNHCSCWAMQASSFAHFVGDNMTLHRCREIFKHVILPNQLSPNGSFPLEIRRTRPYNYSIFNLNVLGITCQLLSTPNNNLWRYSTKAGQGLAQAFKFHYPFLADKSCWSFARDITRFELLPVRILSLMFAGAMLEEQSYLELWMRLDATPTDMEVIRNFPRQQPVLWLFDLDEDYTN